MFWSLKIGAVPFCTRLPVIVHIALGCVSILYRRSRSGPVPPVARLDVGHCYLVNRDRHYYRARLIAFTNHLATVRLIDTGEVVVV